MLQGGVHAEGPFSPDISDQQEYEEVDDEEEALTAGINNTRPIVSCCLDLYLCILVII